MVPDKENLREKVRKEKRREIATSSGIRTQFSDWQAKALTPVLQPLSLQGQHDYMHEGNIDFNSLAGMEAELYLPFPSEDHWLIGFQIKPTPVGINSFSS